MASVADQAASAMRWRTLQLAGVQLIYFLRLMILARLLAPESFGLLAIATIAISLFMTVSNVGMIPALVQKPDATRDHYDGAWTVGLLRAALVAGVLFVAAPIVAALFGDTRAAPIIQALALRPLIDAAASIGIARLTRALQFRELALVYLPGALIDLVVAVAMAPTLGVWALVLGALSGSAATTLVSYVLAPHRPRLHLRWDEIRPLISFGGWVLLTGMVAMVGTLLTQLAVSRSLGAAALGLYFLAQRVASLPINSVDTVIRSVVFPMFARLADDDRATATAFGTLVSGLALLLIPTYCLVIVLAPRLAEVLGPTWRGTAPVMQVMSVTGMTSMLGAVVVPLLMGRGRADRAFRLELVQTGTLLVVLLPCLWSLSVPGAALAVLLGNVAALLVALVWLSRLVPGAMPGVQPRLLAAVLAGAAGGIVAAAVAGGISGLPGLIMAGVAGAAAAMGALWLAGRLWDLRFGELLALVWRRGAA